jgi:striatin 1/3/4
MKQQEKAKDLPVVDQATIVQTITLPKVLHFLQSEWRDFEQERNKWEIEKSELKEKVSLLEGGREGLESMKADLRRRVKMLEYSLKQERY